MKTNPVGTAVSYRRSWWLAVRRHLTTGATCRLALTVAAITLWLRPELRADVIYFGLQNIAIPATGLGGVYLNIDTGVTNENGNWHLNPFEGGAGVGNSPAFQPARFGTGNEDRILNVGFGNAVGAARNYASGFAGSQNSHLGPGADQFDPGQVGYLGFRYTPATSAYYGWMRAIFTAGNTGAMLLDWAYDTSGAAITAGNIQQAAPSGGISVLTLRGAIGEAYTLGSNLSDVGSGSVTAVDKQGAGSWSLGAQSYTGTTTVNGGSLIVGANGGKLAGTSGIVVHNGGTLLFTDPAPPQTDHAAWADRSANRGRRVVLPDADTAVSPTRFRERAFAPGPREPETPLTSIDRINDAASLTINGGGRLNPNGYSEGLATGAMPGLGALTLSSTSPDFRATIDFLAGANGSSLVFSSLSASSAGAYLDILHWTGNSPVGNDRLLFGSIGSLGASDMANVRFFDDANNLIGTGGAFISYGNFQQLVPVPEPATWAAGVLALGALACSARRARLRRTRDS